MDEEIERLVVSVRADTRGFARDVTEMRGLIDGPLASGAERAGRALETTLARALRSGKLGFEDLRRVALAVLGEIAAAALRTGIGAVLGGAGRSGEGGLLGALGGLVGGLPGRATGGPVSPGRGYLVGERGPELFVPTTSGAVAPIARGGGGRDVRVAITIAGPGGSAPGALARSGRQVARAVKAALADVED